MSFLSLTFAGFILITLLIYYLFPRKDCQWTVLLAASYVFYLWADARYVIYILITTVSIFFAARKIQQINLDAKAAVKANKAIWSRDERAAYKNAQQRRARRFLVLTLVLNFGILFFLKYFNFLSALLGNLTGHITPTLRLLLPLGISFYTFQSMSYVIDVYRGETRAEENLVRLALFVSFFPQILQGPISKYDQLAPQLYAPRRADFTHIKYGLELMLWGYFKKLVIAERAVLAIRSLVATPTDYNGTAMIIAVLLYALQLYADFSAGIDIIRGVAQMLGVDMIQNFRQPYFATSLADYWNRWHISLGAWMKNYVFYPLALSKPAVNFTKTVKASRFGRSRLGAYIAVVFPGAVASLIIFLLVGIWHGAGGRYIVYGLYNGGIIMFSTLFKPCFERVNQLLHINVKSFLHRLFQMLRTFLLVCIGNVTDLIGRAGDFLPWLRKMTTDHNLGQAKLQMDNGFCLGNADYALLFFCTLLMLAVGAYHEKHPDVSLRATLEKEGALTQWLLIVFGVLAILIFGNYGPGYNAADFVYVQF